jgi:D-alanine transaminase
MARIAYINGRYLPLSMAAVPIEDRAFLFADGVYEVCEVRDGALIDEERHLRRLARSLRELRIAAPMSEAAIGTILREVVRRNRVRDGMVYLQITRGVAKRNHAFPAAGTPPTVVATAYASDPAAIEKKAAAGISIITVPETRWARVDIKTVSLLPNVLARQAALDAGKADAWFVNAAGEVTEAAASNAWIVTGGGEVVTAPADDGVLRGVTRMVLIDHLASNGLRLVERRFSLEEALGAKEAFMTSATSAVLPVVSIDGRPIGDGKPGPVSRQLRTLLRSSPAKSARYAGALRDTPSDVIPS